MAERSPDKGKEPANLELRMEARMQRMSDNFNEQIQGIQQQVEDTHNSHSSNMD